MPRKAKEKVDEIEEKDKKKNVVKKATAKSTTKKAETKAKTKTTKKADVSKKKTESSKKVSTKKTDTKVKTSTEKPKAKKNVSKKSELAKSIDDETKAKKKTASKSATKSIKKEPAAKSTVKKATDKSSAKKAEKSAEKKDTTKSTTTKSTSKKATTKKSTAKSTAKKSSTKKSKETIQILEYYDLPYKYGNTVVRLLAQTPKTLFVYWEVSDSDIDNFKKVYGEDFYNKTKPILIVHNLTLNKTYEVEINDFANCWYLNTDDTDCKFDIELARKFITNPQIQNDYAEYLYVAQSNDLQSPNDHILFEKLKEFVIFKDVKTNRKIKKDIKSFKFLKDIYKFYKDMYDEDILNNPSSQFKF